MRPSDIGLNVSYVVINRGSRPASRLEFLVLSKPSYSVFVHARKAFTAEGTALVNTMSGVASQWSLPDCCDGADGRYGQLSLVVTPAEAAGDELAAAEVSAGRDIADGLGQCDEAEYARRIVVAYDVLGRSLAPRR